MLPGQKPCGTVLEAAKRKGLKTGLVVTTDITDATPACFASQLVAFLGRSNPSEGDC